MTHYTFKAKLWKYDGPAGWYFVTLPKSLSRTIRKIHGNSEEGWGRLTTSAQINSTIWKTAIWYDTKASAYLLPIKSLVRKTETLNTNSRITVKLKLRESAPFKSWYKR